MKKRKVIILGLFLFVLCIFYESNVYATEVENLSLEYDCSSLTNDDFLDISDITDGSNVNANYSIQDYTQSYTNMLNDDTELYFNFIDNNSTQILKNNYGGNLIYLNGQCKALDNDSIIKIIPQEYFKTVGEHTFFGLNYGFYIKTYIDNDIAYYDGELEDIYVSDVCVIDFTYDLPSWGIDLNFKFNMKPLFSARYYTFDNLLYYDNISMNISFFFLDMNIIIDDSYSKNIITIPNISLITPHYYMEDLYFTSQVENKENLNVDDDGYYCYDDYGLFVNKVSMEYDTNEVMVDKMSFSTSGYKLYDVQIKEEYDQYSEFVSHMLGYIPLVDTILYISEMIDGYYEDTTSDIIITDKTIEYGNELYLTNIKQCDNYNGLIKNVAISVNDVNYMPSYFDIYNCSDLKFEMIYSHSYSNIHSPSINTIGLSFKLYDENNADTSTVVRDYIDYELFCDLELSNDNSGLLITTNNHYYGLIVDVDFTASYSIVGDPFLNVIFDSIESFDVIKIYEINEKNIDEDNVIVDDDNNFILNSGKRYLIEVQSNKSSILNVALIVNSVSNMDILGSDYAKFNYAVIDDGYYLFKLNKSNLDVEITYLSSSTINSVGTLNNSNNTNELFELRKNQIYKIKIYNTSLGNKTGISLNIETNVLLCNEQKILETYLNDDSTCTVIYTAQNNEKITISTSGLLDTEYIYVVVEGDHSYSYEADYIDEENDVYDPNASLTVELEAGESILITINEYNGISGELFIHVIVKTL